MRVLHMIGSLGVGGSQAFVMNIYRKIDKEKVQFDFIIDHQKYDYYIKEIEENGGKVYKFTSFKGTNYLTMIKEWNDFFSSHPEYKILHCHVRSYASLFIPIAKKYGLKVIIHSHSDSNGKGIKPLFKNILQLPLRFQADYYMACSQKAGEWLFGKKVCSSTKFFVIKNAINIEDFLFSEKKRNQIRKQFDIEDKYVVGFIARVTEAKNPTFVIEVLNELIKIKENIVLLFVGDGELLNQTKLKTHELKIEDKVIFTGAKSNVGELLSAMDYYILPSKWEGLGISLIEAQASGIKCFCSKAIPAEALIINENITQLDTNLGALRWAEEIKNTILGDRSDTKYIYDRIKNRGYDVKENAKYFLDFYINILDKEVNDNEEKK